MFDDHSFACLSLFNAPSIDFVWELKLSKSFVLCFVVFGYQVDALESVVKDVCGIFLKS